MGETAMAEASATECNVLLLIKEIFPPFLMDIDNYEILHERFGDFHESDPTIYCSLCPILREWTDSIQSSIKERSLDTGEKPSVNCHYFLYEHFSIFTDSLKVWGYNSAISLKKNLCVNCRPLNLRKEFYDVVIKAFEQDFFDAIRTKAIKGFGNMLQEVEDNLHEDLLIHGGYKVIDDFHVELKYQIMDKLCRALVSDDTLKTDKFSNAVTSIVPTFKQKSVSTPVNDRLSFTAMEWLHYFSPAKMQNESKHTIFSKPNQSLSSESDLPSKSLIESGEDSCTRVDKDNSAGDEKSDPIRRNANVATDRLSKVEEQNTEVECSNGTVVWDLKGIIEPAISNIFNELHRGPWRDSSHCQNVKAVLVQMEERLAAYVKDAPCCLRCTGYKIIVPQVQQCLLNVRDTVAATKEESSRLIGQTNISVYHLAILKAYKNGVDLINIVQKDVMDVLQKLSRITAEKVCCQRCFEVNLPLVSSDKQLQILKNFKNALSNSVFQSIM